MTQDNCYVPYERYKQWAYRKQFRSYKEFRQYAKTYVLPTGFPSNPQLVYEEYEGDPTFLGYRPPKVLPFEHARKKAREMQFTTVVKYIKYVNEFERDKRHSRLPRAPERAYPDEFVSWTDYLGNGNIATKYREFLPYPQAVAFVHKLGIKNYVEWIEYAKSEKRPKFIPFSPWDVYGMWSGLRKWLGTDVVQLIETRTQGHSVLCILHDALDLPNIYSYAVFEGGSADAYLQCKNKFTIVRTYSFRSDELNTFRRIVSTYSSSFIDRSFVAINYNELQFQLDMEFDIIRHKFIL